jgi:glycosyltransferase involved in cell wall biosynthesis
MVANTPGKREGLPLVSIVIPAYKAQFLGQALQSALGQTYGNTEVVVCNDSPESEIGEIVRSFEGSGAIRYVENPRNLGGLANYEQCYDLASGTYVKFLNDDDLLASNCIERMVSFFESFGERVTLVTGTRRKIDERGNELEDDPSTMPLVKGDALIDGRDLGNLMLRHMLNVVGEPTTAMFRKADMLVHGDGLFTLGNTSIGFNVDVAMWLKLLSRGDAVYIEEPLSFFRIHGSQQQQKPYVITGCLVAWADIVREGRRLGFVQDDASYAQAISSVAAVYGDWVENDKLDDSQRGELKALRSQIRTELDGMAKDLELTRDGLDRHKKMQSELRRIREDAEWQPPVKHRPARIL